MLRQRFLRAAIILVALTASLVAARIGTAQGSCATANAGAGWQNASFAPQSGSFTATFDATPSRSPYEALIGLSNGAQTQDSGFAATVRFNPSGRIDARGQGSYTAISAIPYSANTTYHFRVVVNLAAHNYSVFVTATGSEQTVASNIAFRSEQQSVSALNNRGLKVASSSGTLTVCTFTINGSPSPTPSPTRTPAPSATPGPSPTAGGPTPTPLPAGDRPIGFASVNALGQNGTTGGAGGQVVTVTTAAQLEDFVGRPGPFIIMVSGRIQISDMITVVANKSIIGIGSNAEITGGGLQLGSTTRPGNNVIIRNITFTNASDDSVSVTNSAHHVWVDHCDFSNGFDGLLDIKRQSDFVTVSWNHFHDHDKTMLLGHSDTFTADIGHLRVTYHHNFFDRTVQRHPRVRFGEPVHVFNNYYLGNSGYGVASTENAGVLVEGNYFENVQFPIHVGFDESGPGRVVERNNIYVNSGPPETLGTVVEPSSFYAYTLDNPANIPTIVRNGAGVGKIGS